MGLHKGIPCVLFRYYVNHRGIYLFDETCISKPHQHLETHLNWGLWPI